MLIRFFRSSFLLQNLMVLIVAAVLWLPAFIKPIPPVAAYGLQPIYSGMLSVLQNHVFLSIVIAFLILLFSAFYINAILAANGLIGRVASAAALLLVLFFSFSPRQTVFYPLLLALPLLIYLLSTLFKMYESQGNEFNIFNAASAVSLLSMIDIRFLLLFVWLYVALFMLRIVKLKEWLIPFLGFIVPYFFLAAYFFLRNKLLASVEKWLQTAALYDVTLPAAPSFLDALLLALMLIILIQSILIVASPISDHSIFMRKKKSILNALFLFAIAFLFLNYAQPVHALLFLLPAVIFVAYSWMLYRRFFWPQILVVLFFSLAVLNQYKELLP